MFEFYFVVPDQHDPRGFILVSPDGSKLLENVFERTRILKGRVILPRSVLIKKIRGRGIR